MGRQAGGAEVLTTDVVPHAAVLMESFVQPEWARTKEFRAVRSIAQALLAHMNEEAQRGALVAANAPRQSSAGVQQLLHPFLEEQGFADESKGLFKDYATPAVRPDFFRKVGDSGILLEVERGKTTINNMDFLDFWKCHVCPHAHYLFLVVPQELRQNEDSSRVSRPYNAVVKRLGSFFTPGNYTNVRGLFVFGY